MILRVDRVGGRVRVIIDEERVLQQGWPEIKLWRYCNKIKQVCAAIALQEPAKLLQHLFYFIACKTRATIKQNKPHHNTASCQHFIAPAL